jgi:broad specificity phosphatase PhoE
MLIAVIRHASTQWNAEGRMQGRRDVPLSAAGRAEVATWRLPADLDDAIDVLASPLARAVETAQLLSKRVPRIEPALIEMDWGAWEGCSLGELSARYGDAFACNARRGLDFRPHEGESPRDVMARLGRWLATLGARGQPLLVVTHNGVLRALLAIATGWDMTSKPPIRLRPASLHRFSFTPGARPAVVSCNEPLVPVINAAGADRRPPATVAAPR